jgi:WG containing repeat
VGEVDFDRVLSQGHLYRVAAAHTTGTLTYHTFGFVDRSGRVVIAPTLEDVHEFREGLAPFAIGLDWKAVEAAARRQEGH